MKSKTLFLSHKDVEMKSSPKTIDELLNMSFFYVIENLAGIKSTGKCLYIDTLSKILDAKAVLFNSLKNIDMSEYSTMVTLDLVHISGYYNHLDKFYDVLLKNKHIKIVPMSFGIWHDYDLTDRDVLILEMMSERAEIGCRNELIADILNKKGIKNIRVIGCPSMFYHMDRNFSVNNNKKDLQKINFNAYVSPVKFGKATTKHMDYVLREASKYESVFTLQENVISELFDYLPLHDSWFVEMPKYKDKYFQYLRNCGKYFYNVHDWIHGLSDCDFSLSRKLHGGIAAVLAGVPTFCVGTDILRMVETLKYHKVPVLHYPDFDYSKPIEYYYELADYTEFNKNYAQAYDNFVDYCHKNDVNLKIDM